MLHTQWVFSKLSENRQKLRVPEKVTATIITLRSVVCIGFTWGPDPYPVLLIKVWREAESEVFTLWGEQGDTWGKASAWADRDTCMSCSKNNTYCSLTCSPTVSSRSCRRGCDTLMEAAQARQYLYCSIPAICARIRTLLSHNSVKAEHRHDAHVFTFSLTHS